MLGSFWDMKGMPDDVEMSEIVVDLPNILHG